MNPNRSLPGGLVRVVISRFVLAVILLMAAFFLPAGTFAYWQAWVYLAILFLPMFLVMVYLLQRDPGLLERRMRTRERETQQNLIIKLSFIPFLAAFLLPGFDQRFGWSIVPGGLVILGGALVLAGYGIVFLVFRENRYASRVVEVEQEQQVIDSGPYALVRHPMYLGTLLMFVFSPLALGSYWAMLPALLIVPVLVARIRNEESLLARDLPGYAEYMQKTPYRLVPGLW
ncbi:MAG: isoprenylcysteine carboxylmethyltransferase family protein [Chloroflexi bacterium]|jgi:protein-S-isoprenylcysteine O-methyltransferase Ste14|nr:isoprenylcysteine carboxylmethyltransferase family protein [Anaerolineaceae bacterium]NMB88607.1 isoprenylcysteine carboxylmethyltransferase family protein [Chloroflexota bacterium]